LRARTFEEEEKALEEFILAAGQTNVPIEARLRSRQHRLPRPDFVQFGRCALARRSDSSGRRFAGTFPNHIAWITMSFRAISGDSLRPRNGGFQIADGG